MALSLLPAWVGACAPESGAPQGERVACALGDGAGLAEDCTLERLDAEGTLFAIHQPDGGFRRFSFDPKDRSITLADGAESLAVKQGTSPEELELQVGAERYLLDLSQLGRQSE